MLDCWYLFFYRIQCWWLTMSKQVTVIFSNVHFSDKFQIFWSSCCCLHNIESMNEMLLLCHLMSANTFIIKFRHYHLPLPLSINLSLPNIHTTCSIAHYALLCSISNNEQCEHVTLCEGEYNWWNIWYIALGLVDWLYRVHRSIGLTP